MAASATPKTSKSTPKPKVIEENRAAKKRPENVRDLNKFSFGAVSGKKPAKTVKLLHGVKTWCFSPSFTLHYGALLSFIAMVSLKTLISFKNFFRNFL